MQYIRLFLASSINEFHSLRFDLGNYVRMINDDLVTQSRYVELIICEDSSNAVSMTRKQDDYNAEIRTCDAFLILCGSHMGNYTLEEFNIACSQQEKSGRPVIHAAQMLLPAIAEPDESVRSFLQLAGQREIPVHRYQTADALKQDLRALLLRLF